MGLIIQLFRRKLGFYGRFLIFSHKLLTFEQRIFAGVLIDILFDFWYSVSSAVSLLS